MTRRADIVAEALTWQNVKFRHQGRSREEGVDCVGLVAVVARATGLTDYDFRAYAKQSPYGMLVQKFAEGMGPEVRPWTDCRPGDALLMRDNIFTIHAAIVVSTSPLRIVHSYARVRRVGLCYPDKVREDGGVLTDRIARCFQFPGVEDA